MRLPTPKASEMATAVVSRYKSSVFRPTDPNVFVSMAAAPQTMEQNTVTEVFPCRRGEPLCRGTPLLIKVELCRADL